MDAWQRLAGHWKRKRGRAFFSTNKISKRAAFPFLPSMVAKADEVLVIEFAGVVALAEAGPGGRD